MAYEAKRYNYSSDKAPLKFLADEMLGAKEILFVINEEKNTFIMVSLNPDRDMKQAEIIADALNKGDGNG